MIDQPAHPKPKEPDWENLRREIRRWRHIMAYATSLRIHLAGWSRDTLAEARSVAAPKQAT